MNEKTITRISIIGVLISLSFLYLVTTQIFSSHVNIGEIDKSFAGKTVNITGRVNEVSEGKGSMFVVMEDGTGQIKVVLWEDTLEYLEMNGILNDIKEGAEMNVIGNIQIYKGELEIIPVRGNVEII
jgi:DNA/RNA endonuclease YhcR with UshA esterase domain